MLRIADRLRKMRLQRDMDQKNVALYMAHRIARAVGKGSMVGAGTGAILMCLYGRSTR